MNCWQLWKEVAGEVIVTKKATTTKIFLPLIVLLLTIFFVAGFVIIYNVMNKGSKPAPHIDDTPIFGKQQPVYSYYLGIGSITTKTKDFPVSFSVTVEMIICYDYDDQSALEELMNRNHELRDFVNHYFSEKTLTELVPENEKELKMEIMEQLNTRFLEIARVRNILFDRLDIIEND